MQDERIETTVAGADASATQDASMTKEEKTPFSARFKAWGKAFPNDILSTRFREWHWGCSVR